MKWRLALIAGLVVPLLGMAIIPAQAVPEIFCKLGYHRVVKPHPVPHFVCKRNHP